MSYDINFWKQDRPLALSPQEIYERLNKGESVDGLASLPVEKILERIRAAFPDFDPTEAFPLAETPGGSIEFGWSQQRFRFDIRGNLSDCQKLIDIMYDFECPMYDPAEGKRHDSQNGVKVGIKPRFDEPADKFESIIKIIQKAQAAGKIQPLDPKMRRKP